MVTRGQMLLLSGIKRLGGEGGRGAEGREEGKGKRRDRVGRGEREKVSEGKTENKETSKERLIDMRRGGRGGVFLVSVDHCVFGNLQQT